MPQGPPELHDKWCNKTPHEYIGTNFEGCGDSNAIWFLEAAGYKQTNDADWGWIKPEGHKVTEEESEALWYLQLEWDYGGLVE